MKKISCLALVFSLIAYTASAQFYLRLGAGYALPQAGQTLDGTGQPYNGSSNNGNISQGYSVKGASFSSGLQSSIGAGYMFNEHVGIQADLNIGLATKKYTFNFDSVLIQGVESTFSSVQRSKTPVFFTPSLVLQTGDDKPLNLYARFGVVLPLSTKITQDQIEINLPNTGALQDLDFTLVMKNSFSIGFSAAAGLKYKISDKVSIWGEMSLLSMSLYTKEQDLTAFSYNGQSQSLSAVSGPPVVKYTKSGVIDSVQQIAYSQPFSNIGVNVGISFNLTEKKQKRSRHADVEVGDDKPFRRR